jgi:hypothetical protein
MANEQERAFDKIIKAQNAKWRVQLVSGVSQKIGT